MSIRGVTPYLIVDGAAAAIAWYIEAFDASEVTRMTGGAGRIAHAELRIGPASVFIADEHPHYEMIVGPAKTGGTPVYLDVETADVVGLHDRAVAAGATSIRAPTDPAMAVQSAKVRDPFGHVWLITRVSGD
jgi:PhnB protein